MRFIYPLSVMLFLVVRLTATAQPANRDSVASSRAREDDWFFRAGDSTGWASPAYVDRHWTEIDPTVDLDENPALWRAGRGWFRQTFRFQRLRNKDVTITIEQFGESDVYLDGRLMARLRPDRYESGGSQRLVAMLPVRITDTNRHVLAIRYAFRRDPVLGKVVSKNPFRLTFELRNQAARDLIDRQRKGAGITFLLVGVFGILSLLHFLFYRANPTQPINRVLAATMLAFCLSFLVDGTGNFTSTLTLDSLQGALAQLSFNASFALLLLSVYTYLGRRPGWLFWGTVGLLAIDGCYTVFIGNLPGYASILLPLPVLAEYIRVSWLARRRSPDPDARLPWNSLKVTIYALLAIMLMGVAGGIISSLYDLEDGFDWLTVPIVVIGLVGLFSIPLALSLSLVRDYARTYLSLRQKLDEVEQLSTQTLRYEQEKQHLLAHQNERLEQQVAHRTAELKHSLTELRETQTQLVQREKLASLGELTAGIAHEIQNPLNFVNNFAEVSSELVEELREEAIKPDRDLPLVGELLGDLTQNLAKIAHHGSRASRIVNGMLEHSRTSTGQREPTDLNALTDEYLQLAYHGLRRSGDPAIDIRLVTHFAADPGRVDVVAQDIGRVLVNVFNNAFYATRQRTKTSPPDYRPTITVQTERAGATIHIRIRDNGTGMSEATRNKIFQPFFTTKPTGEGTGLGLSLSYDIITKGHGGSLTAETAEGEGTTVIIGLPVA